MGLVTQQQQVSHRCCCGPSLFSGFFPVCSRPVLLALPARVTTLSQQHPWVPPSFLCQSAPLPLPVPSPRAPRLQPGPLHPAIHTALLRPFHCSSSRTARPRGFGLGPTRLFLAGPQPPLSLSFQEPELQLRAPRFKCTDPRWAERNTKDETELLPFLLSVYSQLKMPFLLGDHVLPVMCGRWCWWQSRVGALACVCVCVCVRARTCVSVHARVCPCMHVCLRAYVCPRALVSMCARVCVGGH